MSNYVFLLHPKMRSFVSVFVAMFLHAQLFKNGRLFLNIVSDLSEPVDVYSDWIDACEAANQ